MLLYLRRLTLALPVAAALAFSANANPISTIYAFGDSLSDAGNVAIATGVPAAPYVNGHFTNGQVWVQDLAASLGLSPLTASLAGGTDYAVGGALAGSLPFYTASAATGDLPFQIAAFHAANPSPNPNALYTLWIGSNDLNAILGLDPTHALADAAIVVGNIDTAIATLAADGAKNLLVLTVPDLGKTPDAIAAGPLGEATASGLSAYFDSLLVPSLAPLASADSLNLNVLDTYSLVDDIVAKPAQFGLTDATDPCLTGITVPYASGTPCANPSQYLFWDGQHPTAAGHSIVAADALQILTPEPATWALLGVGAIGFFAVRRRVRAA